jgi:hypothetical protein
VLPASGASAPALLVLRLSMQWQSTEAVDRSVEKSGEGCIAVPESLAFCNLLKKAAASNPLLLLDFHQET